MNNKIAFVLVLLAAVLLAAFASVSNAEAGKDCSTVGLPFNQVYNPDAGVGELGYVYKLDPNYHMLAGNVKDVAGYYQGDPDEWGLTLFYRIQTDCE